MLEGRGSKMASAGGGDRLSALPDVVLEHVISFLPSVDAVRTCVLARRWRGLWLSMPSLRVDGESVKECHRFLDHLLLLRGHAPIDTCDLSFDDFSKRDVPYLNLWIRYAVMCRVRVLRFYADWRRGERLPVGDLPLITNTLTRLRLHGVDLGERTTHFSGCPVLEELKLTECSHMTAEITSNSLKRLRLTDSYFSCLDYRARISTPNLVKLRIYNLGGHFPLLKSMPSLVTSFIWFGSDSLDYCEKTESWGCSYEYCAGCICAGNDTENSVLLDGLSSATSIELIITDQKVFIFRRDLRWCPTFSKLKTLVLNDWCVGTELHALVCILQHTPVLQKLTLHLCKNAKQKMQPKERHSLVEQLLPLKHLKKVEVICPSVDERVCTILEILRTFGIARGLVDIQQTQNASVLSKSIEILDCVLQLSTASCLCSKYFCLWGAHVGSCLLEMPALLCQY